MTRNSLSDGVFHGLRLPSQEDVAYEILYKLIGYATHSKLRLYDKLP